MRLSSTNRGTANYLYDGKNLIEELDNSGNVLARYTQGDEIDEPLSEVRAGSTSYYQQDGINSVTSLSSGAGALANTYSYDSFGKQITFTGTLTNRFQFTGREFDSETGIYQYRARYYDENVGRFISEDPVGFDGGIDFYTYVEGNPVTFADPMGLAPVLPPPVSPWTLAEEEAYQAFVQGLQETSSFLSNAVGGGIGLLYLVNPSFANNFQWGNSQEAQYEQGQKRCGRWHCRAKCPIKNFSFLPNIPEYVFGEGWGNSEGEAKLAAEKDANTKVPRGTHKRHCSFKCEKR